MTKTPRHPLYAALEAHLGHGDPAAALYWMTSYLADITERLTVSEKRIDQILEMMSGLIEVNENMLKAHINKDSTEAK